MDNYQIKQNIEDLKKIELKKKKLIKIMHGVNLNYINSSQKKKMMKN